MKIFPLTLLLITFPYITALGSNKDFAKEVEYALVDPTTTYIVQASFAFFSLDPNDPSRGRLRLFNIPDYAYFFRLGKEHGNKTFGYITYPDLVDKWTEKEGVFHKEMPEGILVYYLSSVRSKQEHGEFTQTDLKFKNPFYNTLSDSIIFDVETVSGQKIDTPGGELIDVTLFID